MVQYYTLQEAAARLRVSPEALKEMAKNGEVRAFQDRGSLRFRSQEVDELARIRGLSSEPELQLSDAPPVTEAPRTPRPASPAPKSEPSVFDFTLGTDDSDEVSLGQDLTPSSSKDIARKSPAPKSSPPKSGTGAAKSPAPKPGSGMRSPAPAASDSDVRLVSDGTGLDFQVELDRSLRVEQEPPSSHRSGSSMRKAKPEQIDSGVRIVPLDQASDSDVKMVPDPTGSGTGSGSRARRGGSSTESDVRVERGSGVKKRDDLVTEEIDLDAEQRKAEEAGRASRVGKVDPGPKRTQIGATSSQPFELAPPSASGVGGPGSKAGKSGVRPPVAKKDPDTSSSEFELTPADARPSSPPKSSVIKSPGAASSGKMPGPKSSTGKAPPKAPPAEEVPILMGDEDVNLGELTGAAGESGINLKDPADSGISLEQGSGSDEVEFELSLDSGASNPSAVAAPASGEKSSSNEFELSMDDGSGSSSDSDSESEFELSLDVPEGSSVKVDAAEVEAESESEFELSLDEAGELAEVEESESDSGSGEQEKGDVYETDFEVPALEEGSSSEAVALDEGEETSESSSDFDLDLTEEPASDSETGSQVVALDDSGEADEGAETVAKPRRKARQLVEQEEGEETDLDEDLEGDLGEEAEDETERETTVYVPAPAAEWGVVPAILLIPSVIVLFLACLMTFELVQGLWGFHRGSAVTGPVTHAIAGMFTDLPKPKE
jgi:excisionase family DNA binding protein